MRILVVNPNTSADVTDLLIAAGEAVAAPETELVPLTAPRGFPYIAGPAEAQVGGAIAIEMLADHHRDADAAIIAAFGDPGLAGARQLFDIPVIGMSAAAMLSACLLGHRFAIVTFAPALAAWFHDCVEANGLAARYAGIFGLDGAFATLAGVQDEKQDLLVELANRAAREAHAEVVILAGAPLAGLAAKVADGVAVPLVDPIAAAVKQAEALIALAPRKATAGAGQRPAAKETSGLPRSLAARFGHRD